MSLVCWLPLNGNLDNQGLSEIIVTNNGATVDNNGKIGKCYSFDGTDDYISLSSTALYDTIIGGNNPFSIAMWLYRADATRAILFGDYGLSGEIKFNLELRADHAVRFYWNASPDLVLSNATVTQSTWNHLVITYDGSCIRCYIDGVLKQSYNVTLNAMNKTSGAYYLGRDNRTGTTALNGRINDFRLYDHCLSPKEISEIAKGMVCNFKLSGIGKENLMTNTYTGCNGGSGSITHNGYNGFSYRYLKNEETSYSDTISCGLGFEPSPNTKYTISFWAKGTCTVYCFFYPDTCASGISSTGSTSSAVDGRIAIALTDEWAKYWITWTTLSSVSGNKNTVLGRIQNQGVGAECYIAGVKFELGDRSTPWIPNASDALYSALGLNDNVEYDTSGYSNNGLTNSTPPPENF